jgi:hypothetical protein
MLLIFAERGGADSAELAASKRRLQHVRGIHRAFGSAGADDGVDLVDEEDDLALGLLYLLNNIFQRSSNSPRYLVPAIRSPRSRETSSLSRKRLGHIAEAMRIARPSAIAVLPTPASPMSIGLFLVRRERIWMMRDLFVAADDWVELVLLRELGERAGVLGERFKLLLLLGL